MNRGQELKSVADRGNLKENLLKGMCLRGLCVTFRV